MTPEDAATDYLVSYLQGDSTLMAMLEGDIAPEVRWGTLASPFVRIDKLDGTDLMVVGLNRVWGDMTYHVRGCLHWRGSGAPDRTEINAIGQRLDELLHAHEANTAALSIHSFREEPEPDSAVTDGDELWLQSGGIYRVRAHVF